MKIRAATAGDAPGIAALLIRSISALCTPDHGDDPAAVAEWTANKTPDNVARWIAAPGMIALVAVDETGLAGVAMADEAGAVHLNYVDPARRFNGVSAALLAALEARLREAGVRTARLTSTKTALPFYLRRGWTAAGDEADALTKQL